MIDKKAFYTLTYGLYIVSTAEAASGLTAGCMANTFLQVTSEPPRVSVALNKENYTTGLIQRSGIFAVATTTRDTPMETIGLFGFQSGRDVDKFAQLSAKQDEQGIPYVSEQIAARFSVKVRETVDAGTHLIFVGDVVASEKCADVEPLSYAYYRQVKGGKTPPKAPSYQGEAAEAAGIAEAAGGAQAAGAARAGDGARTVWRCSVCGHREIAEELPSDFICPICKQERGVFVKVAP